MKITTIFLMIFFVGMFTISAQRTSFSGIEIFPSLVTDNYLTFESEYKALIDVIIYDLLGNRTIETRKDIKNEKYIDISKLPSGLYIVQLLSGNEEKILRFYKK